ncbi:MAG: hypothetical protein NWT08_09615 [Akkermansiaceae bacterium]|nr:hypothetical protein [Akkermansiaceae bacterium]MDP4647004.1 hypothetical protein [Akkermansiaceae bacterium]MDP4721297.1 hypothetical protein [Akkermansiaceae bacterium]MDP4778987.1 hypothetical protein [Akkermansiaceae bacterium]MDP4847189.1 hypothetical protein [Akkermansiaceae bacterium]
MTKTVEDKRLHEKFTGSVAPWSKWGPYVSDRAWGTVREDYSAHGGGHGTICRMIWHARKHIAGARTGSRGFAIAIRCSYLR